MVRCSEGTRIVKETQQSGSEWTTIEERPEKDEAFLPFNKRLMPLPTPPVSSFHFSFLAFWR